MNGVLRVVVSTVLVGSMVSACATPKASWYPNPLECIEYYGEVVDVRPEGLAGVAFNHGVNEALPVNASLAERLCVSMSIRNRRVPAGSPIELLVVVRSLVGGRVVLNRGIGINCWPESLEVHVRTPDGSPVEHWRVRHQCPVGRKGFAVEIAPGSFSGKVFDLTREFLLTPGRYSVEAKYFLGDDMAVGSTTFEVEMLD